MEQTSQTIGKLVEALSKAQGVMEDAKKDSKNPFFKSSYADLGSMWNACRKPLSDNGLAVIQTIESLENKSCLITTLAHASGEWIKSVLPLPITKLDPQTIGSAITYCRRYALGAIVGIASAEDDDGEKAMTSFRKQSQQLLSPQQIDEVLERTNGNQALLGRILEHNQVESLEEITSDKFERIMVYLDKATQKIQKMA